MRVRALYDIAGGNKQSDSRSKNTMSAALYVFDLKAVQQTLAYESAERNISLLTVHAAFVDNTGRENHFAE